MNKIEILEKATALVARNLFEMKYKGRDPLESKREMEECINDSIFVINNFMRISADLAREDAIRNSTAGEESWGNK